jgi:hypothetical protein
MYSAGRMVWEAGWMIHIVEEIKLLLLLGNRLKHIRGNVRYLMTWNIKEFTVGYFLRLDEFFLFFILTPIFIMQSAVCIQHNDIIIESCGVTLISDAP